MTYCRRCGFMMRGINLFYNIPYHDTQSKQCDKNTDVERFYIMEHRPIQIQEIFIDLWNAFFGHKI